MEFTATEQKGRKQQACLRDLWDNIKYTKYSHYGVQGGGEREKGPEKMEDSIQQSPCSDLMDKSKALEATES